VSTVVAIVEGDGEVKALPVLLRRIAQWKTPERNTRVLAPIRVRRDRFLKLESGEFERYLQLAAAQCGNDGWILLLLDADDDCPARLGPALVERARLAVNHRRVSVVLANREYEAWFMACASSLTGIRGFTPVAGDELIDAETPRDAKGWVRQRMPGRSYGEVIDQPAMSASMDLALTYERSRSFRKLCEEWTRQEA
jgi:hypothetical protein